MYLYSFQSPYVPIGFGAEPGTDMLSSDVKYPGISTFRHEIYEQIEQNGRILTGGVADGT